jgi:WD40 repeat protein
LLALHPTKTQEVKAAMFSSQSADVSLDAPCRAISSVRADKVESRFLAGSCSPPHAGDRAAADPTTSGSGLAVNHLYLLRFHSEVNELGIDARIPHDTGPVSSIVCSPTDPSLVVTTTTMTTTRAGCGSSASLQQGAAATLWKIPRSIVDQHDRNDYQEGDDNDDEASASSASHASNMEAVAALRCDSGEISDVVWGDGSSFLDAASTTGGEVVTLERNGVLTQWDVSLGKAQSARQISATRNGGSKPSRCAFPPRVALDPHASSVGDAAAVSVGPTVHLVDWRSDASIPTGTVDKFCAHQSSVVTGLDYNPNKPYVLATSGQDGLIKVRVDSPRITLFGG